MLKNLFVIFILSFIFSITLSGQTTQNNIRPSIERIVSKLSKENRLHLGGPVGYAGVPETNNKYYKLYQKLGSKATDQELVALTKNNSKTVVLYSFLILYSRNFNRLKDIFIKNINDTSEVWIAGGCIGSLTKVNTFMLRQLNPAYMDSREPYISQDEYEKYLIDFGESK